MTTTAALPQHRRLWHRRPKAERPLVNGRPIRFRRLQKLAWVGMSIALGAGVIAGLYWFGLQQDWHNIFPFLHKGTSAKTWWDNGMGGLIKSAKWPFYRHGVRDNGEPETWALIGGVLLGSATTARIIKARWLVIGGLVLLVMVIAGAVGITWFINFGPGTHLPNPVNAQNLILGMLVGRALHMIWAPLGNSVRYQLISRSVSNPGIPMWVRYPLAPPTWRETWSKLRASGEIAVRDRADRFRQSRLFIPVMVILILVIAIVGDLAKWGFAHGMHVPLLNP